jgi:hypothetical protein
MRTVRSLVNSHFGVQSFEREEGFASEIEDSEMAGGILVTR